jgi:hypothetical protein
MRRQLYTGGGIASLQRQGYGLGDIVGDVLGKAGKVVKQVVKSPIGKAALLGLGGYYLGGGQIPGLMKGSSRFGFLPYLKHGSSAGSGFGFSNILPNIKNLGTMGQVALGTGAALAFAGIPDPTGTKGFEMAKRKGTVEEYLRRHYKAYYKNNWEKAWNQDEEDEFVNKYSEYNQGGRVGLQAGGQPVVDERMKNTLEENVRMNNLQKELNERVKHGSRTQGLEIGQLTDMYGKKSRDYPVYSGIEGTTQPTEAQSYGAAMNMGLRPEQVKAVAYFNTLRNKYGDQGMMAPQIAPPMFHQGQSVAMPMSGGLSSFTGVAPGTSPLAPENFFKTPAEMFAQYQEGLRRSMMLNPNSDIYYDPDKTYDYGEGVSPKGIYTFREPEPRRGMMIAGKEYFSEQEAIDDMGIERYNQLMSKGGRVGLYGGSGPVLPETEPEINIQDLIQEEGIQVGPQVKKLDAGAPSIKRTGNMETEDSQLVERYNEHKQEGGTMSFDEFEKYESMTAYYPGDIFSRAEISALFRDKSLTTNMDRKQLHKILMNPGMFPEAEEMLIKLLRSGNATGGRVGLRRGTPNGGISTLDVEEEFISPEYLQQEEGVPIGPMAGIGGVMKLFETPYGFDRDRFESMMLEWNASDKSLGLHDFALQFLDMVKKDTPKSPVQMAAHGGRIGAFGGGVMGGRVGLKVLRDLYDNDEEEAAQGGRIGYAGGTNDFDEDLDSARDLADGYMREGMSESDAWERAIKEVYKINLKKGGRVGAFGGGVMGIGTPGMRLPGIPQMAPDGLEYNMKAGGFQNLGAKEGKDDVNAKLAKNEFVMTADAVRGAGGGNIEVGAQRMYDTMKQLEGKVV